MNARRDVSRRAFLRATGMWGTSMVLAPALHSAGADNFTGKIMTVLGAIDPGQLGLTLSHEHAIVDFLGAEKAQGPRHDSEDAFATVLPHLKTFREHGGRALVECTPNYIGRDVRLLKRLAEASRLHIITNTGYYGASGNKFLPKHAFTESADQLSARWLAEWRDGIDGTGVRPGFLKLGVEKGKLSEVHTKLIRAAARVHHASGLPIAIHTGDGIAALDEVRILREEAVAPSALIWVHAQNDPGPTHLDMAKLGAWVSLDGCNAKNRDRYTKFLTDLKREKLLGRVLLSHDHYWSVEGEGGRGSLKLHSGGAATAYESIFTDLLPHLRAHGFSDDEIQQLTVRNPAEALAIRVRKL
ncbi:MAG TPA: phosphotriesterase [Candidatus Limnocylindria bacterium]|nr:phosphotriesterase [Candidatus Limnocylindria bacterium]